MNILLIVGLRNSHPDFSYLFILLKVKTLNPTTHKDKPSVTIQKVIENII